MKTEFNTAAIHEQYAKSSNDNTLQNVPANISDKDYEVIIHQKKLDEGVDLPQAKILILTYRIGSGRELVQTVGRVVRIYEDYKPYVAAAVIQQQANATIFLLKNNSQLRKYKKIIKTT